MTATTRESGAVLIIDDQPEVCEMFRRQLERSGLRVSIAHSGQHGLAAAKNGVFDVILLDLRLPDIDGLQVLSLLREVARAPPVVVVSGFLTVAVTVDIIKLGAFDVLEKPVIDGRLCTTVESAIHSGTAHADSPTVSSRYQIGPPPPVNGGHSAAYKWATYVARARTAKGDFNTIEEWARHVGTSYTMLCETCRMVNVRPRDARDLARALCAIVHASQLDCLPSVLLNISDSRTLRAFQQRAGSGFEAAHGFASLDRFLESQQFVEGHNLGLRMVRQMLREEMVQRASNAEFDASSRHG